MIPDWDPNKLFKHVTNFKFLQYYLYGLVTTFVFHFCFIVGFFSYGYYWRPALKKNTEDFPLERL